MMNIAGAVVAQETIYLRERVGTRGDAVLIDEEARLLNPNGASTFHCRC